MSGKDYTLKKPENEIVCEYCHRPYDPEPMYPGKIQKIENPNILIEANNIVHGDRNEAYGHPKDNHTTTAILFSHFLKRKYGKGMGTTPLLDAEDVCFFNILQKISRAANSYRRDNLVDIAGFAANIEMIKNQEITEIHSERR